MTEYEKMCRGAWYDAGGDPELLRLREEAQRLCARLNGLTPGWAEEREDILDRLLPRRGTGTVIVSPFYADYGGRIAIGEGTFLNGGAYLMDGGGITVGAHCFIGPNCGMYTADHPLLPEERDTGMERAR